MALGMWRLASVSASSARRGDDGAKAHLARDIAQDSGEGLVVLDHQQDAPGVGQRLAVVLDQAPRRGRRRAPRRGAGRGKLDRRRAA